MADEADIAYYYIDAAMKTALSQRQQNVEIKMGAEFCKECGEAIPMERRSLGFQQCITCAEENERRKSQFANY